jgi:hypothetical protein
VSCLETNFRLLPLSIWAALTDVVLAVLGSESINGEIKGTHVSGASGAIFSFMVHACCPTLKSNYQTISTWRRQISPIVFV